MADEFGDCSQEDIKDLFEGASKYLRHVAGSQSGDNLLYFYARYKQVLNYMVNQENVQKNLKNSSKQKSKTDLYYK